MKLVVRVRGNGCKSELHIHLDAEDGEEIGCCEIGMDDGMYTAITKHVTGRHAIYFTVKAQFGGWFKEMENGRHLFELEEFVFMK